MRNLIVKKDLKEITDFNLPWHKFYGKTVLITGAAGMLLGIWPKLFYI